MKIIALIIVAFSLILGVVGAVTAYLPRIDSDAAAGRVEGLNLNAPAGQRDGEPIAVAGTQLDAATLAELREAGVERVKTREFAPGRWTGWWLFALGCIGLLAAGLWLRRDAARSLAEDDADPTRAADPAATLAAIRSEVDQLLHAIRGDKTADTGPSAFDKAPAARPPLGTAEVPSFGTAAPAGSPAYAGPNADAPLHAPASSPGTASLPYARPMLGALIVERIGALQKTHLPAFIDARAKIVSVGGMAGYARLMDAYAAAERQLNRAWSAAADGHEAEAVAALERSVTLLDESASRLPHR